ncbi:Large-conductance mechanosensitive channel [Rothia kristinae]|nr:Large-conductance mechanosensitive channel [Rothia kristinae]
MAIMLSGFKDFISKGNVIDLAVGVIIGGAFSTVVNALVESVLMPLISMLIGSPNFDSSWSSARSRSACS